MTEGVAMKKSHSDFVYGIEYNFKNPNKDTFGSAPDIDSVYLLSSFGRIKVDIKKCAYWKGFRKPFGLLCENTPFRTTFYYESYNQLMMADYLTNKHVITLVGLSRVYEAILNYNAQHQSPSEQIDYGERLKFNLPISGKVLVDDSTGIYIRSDSLTLPSGVALPTGEDLLCYPYIFEYDPALTFDNVGTNYYHWRVTDIDIKNTRTNSIPFTNLFSMTQGGVEADSIIPLYIMDRGDSIPNITHNLLNVLNVMI